MSNVIERPEMLKQAQHLLRWASADLPGASGQNFDVTKLSPREWEMLRQHGLDIGGPTGFNLYAKFTQCLEGVQMSVAQQVSQDMERSTISCRANDIRLPAESIEMIFCDPTLPSVLVTRLAGSRIDGEGVIFAIDAKETLDTGWILVLPTNKLDVLLDPKSDITHMKHTVRLDADLEPEESEAMRYMALLCLKVLAYSQIPQFAPVAVKTHAEKKAAGLLIGAAKRPERPAFVIRYLPRVIRDPKEKSGNETGLKRTFKGRLGHIRHFNSDFFTHAKGTWKYIPPTPAPEGVKVQYRVRYIKNETKQKPAQAPAQEAGQEKTGG